MKKHKYICCVSFFLLLAGCGYIATSQDVGGVQSQIDNLSKETAKKYDALNNKVSTLEKNQTDSQTNVQASLMDLSDRMKNDIKDTKTAFDESQNVLTGKIEDMAKKQEASNLSYKSDLDTFKKSYNDTLTTLNSFNSSFVTYQNDLMSMKQNMDTLNSKQDSLTKEIASLNTEFNNKINVLLNEIVNQESEIFILQTKLTDLSGTKTQSKNKIYIVKKGDTILKISNKFNVPVDKLKKANKLKRGTVSEGQKLIIP